jgi:hypothetical protein
MVPLTEILTVGAAAGTGAVVVTAGGVGGERGVRGGVNVGVAGTVGLGGVGLGWVGLGGVGVELGGAGVEDI